MDKNSSIRQANEHFKKGDYQQAIKCYEQAGQRLGYQNVKANIQICERRLGKAVKSKVEPQPNSSPIKTITMEEQLAKTQALLEDYFQRYQQLQLQTMDAR